MKAVILAAGVGSRLRPITLEKPKPAIEVNGASILEHQLRAYGDAGIDEVYVVTGYMSGDVRSVCKRVEKDLDGVTIETIKNDIYANTENMYSLYITESELRGEEFLLSNGDVVFDRSIPDGMVSESNEASYIACDPANYSQESMKIAVEDDRVDRISKNIEEGDAFASSIDLYYFNAAFSKRLFQEIEQNSKNESSYSGWTEKVIDDLLGDSNLSVRPYSIGEKNWVEIDDRSDLLYADRTFAPDVKLGDKEAVFFDLDGTLYLGDSPVDGAMEVVKSLKSSGVELYYISNNSSGWKDQYAAKLESMGIEANPDDIILSTDGVINYLKNADATETYVVGTEAMRDAIESEAINPVSDSPSHVVVGFDKELTYEKIRKAALMIQNGAEFLVAHQDEVCPTSAGNIPDCGSMAALFETATDQNPDRIFGKPNEEMLTHIIQEKGYTSDDIAIVGDRLQTEIALAERLGCDSICTLSGDATREGIEASSIAPTVILESVGGLSEFI
ncbi:HAD-IIA family hydrolase [Haloarcula sp. CBA1130]|nr:HAD-IIA family hydrolase [Haloarcula sp. CBA1130]KAA9398363.1 HAD-IIA family hydrolase [Haloarcula sp. CBA1129]KAA9402042.1 HAD-IIA family hydrolase [Haloarcula sp. CBA1130]